MDNMLKNLVTGMHQSFSDNHLDKTLDYAADDVEIKAYALGLTLHGREGFKGFIEGFKTAMPDARISYRNMLIDGDKVTVEFTCQGTHTGPLQSPAGDIPATGKHVSLDVCEVMHWENGKLKSLHNYQDAASLLRQVGAL